MNKYAGWAKKFFGQLLIQGDVGQATPCLKIVQGNNQTGNIFELDNPLGTTTSAVNGANYPTISLSSVGIFTLSYGNNVLTLNGSGNIITAGNFQGATNTTGVGYGPTGGNISASNFVSNNIQGGAVTATSTNQTNTKISWTINQSGTAGFTTLLLAATETTVGSGIKRMLSSQVGGSEQYGIDDGGVVYPATAQTTVAGATSGTLVASQPFAGSSFKKIVLFLNALTGAASYTYPTAFINTPMVINALSFTVSATTTSVTVTGASSTGFVVLEGY